LQKLVRKEADMNADDDATDSSARAKDLGLSPERRLDAIADIILRGLARLLIAEDSAARRDVADVAQTLGNRSEVALLNGRRDAFMVMRDGQRAEHGGRKR
jgi:hypothetical protein